MIEKRIHGFNNALEFLHRSSAIQRPILFCGQPFNRESLDENLQPYAEYLEAAGYSNLIPRLDRKNEILFLHQLEDAFKTAYDIIRPRGKLPRPTHESRNIRQLMESVMQKSEMDSLYYQIKVIEPEHLSGLCAFDERNNLQLTDFGKIIVKLKKKWPNFHIQYIRGRARDSTGLHRVGVKPPIEDVRALRIPTIAQFIIEEEVLDQKPKLLILTRDTDFLGFTDSDHPTLEEIAECLREDILSSEHHASAIVKKSDRRDFIRVDFRIESEEDTEDLFGRLTRNKSRSLGHLFGGNIGNSYNLKNPTLPFSMGNARIDIPIELIPVINEHGEDELWGCAIDSFGGNEDTKRHRLAYQKWLNREYRQAICPFPEVKFNLHFPQEVVCEIGYDLRTAAWHNLMIALPLSSSAPIVEADLEPASYPSNISQDVRIKLPKASGDTRFLKRGLPKQTQEVLTAVIANINLISRNRKDQFGTQSQRIDLGLSLIEDIADALDGDFITTLMRLLPAGESVTKNHPDFFELDVLGLNIIGQDGIFTNLGKEFSRHSRTLDFLKERIITLVRYQFLTGEQKERKSNSKSLNSIIKGILLKNNWLKPDLYQLKGRKVLFDFLFQTAQGDAKKVLAYLKPVWCTEKEWQNLNQSDEHIERLIAIDERFVGLHPEIIVPEAFKNSVREIIEQMDVPISVYSLHKLFKTTLTSNALFYATLEELLTEQKLRGIGQPILRSEIEKARHSPQFLWVCTSQLYDKFQNDSHFSSANNAIFLTIFQGEPTTKVEVIAERAGLSPSLVKLVIKKLLRDGSLMQTSDGIYEVNTT
jgi:hypothetical protein